ncbi:single-stranded-DNA-specific exonuclease RecJ [Candidatus Saccharibacteria bacterium]|nr:single-stranded-DNA-specific exonuclease RecJ [Candidatus Saccharibacteria bacterium]
MTRIFRELLKKRGLDVSFLRPQYEDLFDPFLMLGVKEAVKRIEVARERRERIVIYGDYDADGVTASTVMAEGLEYFGFGREQITIMLPDRFKDGYGMNVPVVPEIVATGATLVITVDCGSGSEEAIAVLRAEGVETIVTDHHEIPQMPQSAVTVINPKLPGEQVGLRMAGVGVAFTVVRALNMRKRGVACEKCLSEGFGRCDRCEREGGCDGQEKWLLDLVAIGTVCDSMVLQEENRIMVAFGLKVLRKTRRVGLRELAKRAGVVLEAATTETIGFQVGPRINAAGRLASARIALNLLRAKSRAEAVKLADRLEELNKERRRLQEAAVNEVVNGIGDEAVIVVAGKWHEGVVGIVAGRLTELYKRPSFALAELADGRLKGSGRSFGDFSLAQMLQGAFTQELLLTGGGHAGACGLSLEKEKIAEFREFANSYYGKLGLRNQERYLQVKSDIVLDDFKEVNEELVEELAQLEPFGEGNLEPVFEVVGLVTGLKILKEKHLSLILRDVKGQYLKMMAFYASREWMMVKEGGRVRVKFYLMRNEWRGQVRIEGRIAEISIEDDIE